MMGRASGLETLAPFKTEPCYVDLHSYRYVRRSKDTAHSFTWHAQLSGNFTETLPSPSQGTHRISGLVFLCERPTQLLSLGLRCSQSSANSLLDHGSLELSEDSRELEEQFPHDSCACVDSVVYGYEPH